MENQAANSPGGAKLLHLRKYSINFTPIIIAQPGANCCFGIWSKKTKYLHAISYKIFTHSDYSISTLERLYRNSIIIC
jgi:hypothetical protein